MILVQNTNKYIWKGHHMIIRSPNKAISLILTKSGIIFAYFHLRRLSESSIVWNDYIEKLREEGKI